MLELANKLPSGSQAGLHNNSEELFVAKLMIHTMATDTYDLLHPRSLYFTIFLVLGNVKGFDRP